jgi:hypothetical protein
MQVKHELKTLILTLNARNRLNPRILHHESSARLRLSRRPERKHKKLRKDAPQSSVRSCYVVSQLRLRTLGSVCRY